MLGIAANVRDRVDLDADPGFVANIGEHHWIHPRTADSRGAVTDAGIMASVTVPAKSQTAAEKVEAGP